MSSLNSELTYQLLDRNHLESFYRLFELIIIDEFRDYQDDLIEYYLKYEYPFEYFKLWMVKSRKVIFIALNRRNEVVAFIVCRPVFGGIGLIEWLGVDKDTRGKGIARKLLHMYENYCVKNDAHKIELHTSIPKLYEKHDYEVLFNRKNGYFGLDRTYMEKNIGNWNGVKLPSRDYVTILRSKVVYLVTYIKRK